MILIHLNNNEILGSYYSIQYPFNNKNEYYKDDKSFLFYFNTNTNKTEIYKAKSNSNQHLRIHSSFILMNGFTFNTDGLWINSSSPNKVGSGYKYDSTPYDITNSTFFINNSEKGYNYSRIIIVKLLN